MASPSLPAGSRNPLTLLAGLRPQIALSLEQIANHRLIRPSFSKSFGQQTLALAATAAVATGVVSVAGVLMNKLRKGERPAPAIASAAARGATGGLVAGTALSVVLGSLVRPW